MNIERLFSTNERVRILADTIYKTGHLSVNEVAKDVNLSKGLVSKYFSYLLAEGVLEKKNGRYEVQNNVNTKAIKIFLNLNLIDTNIFRKYDFIRSVGLYGSYVKGTNTEESDIDMWIIIDETGEEGLAKLTSELKQTLGNVRPLYLTGDKMESLKKRDTTFYHSIIFGSITIYGDEIEAIWI